MKEDMPARPEHGSEVVHEVDGIQELDNRLPRWWLYSLYGTIAFAAFYWFGYQVLHAGELPKAAYDRETAAAAEVKAKETMALGTLTPEALVAMTKAPAVVAQGKEVFTSTCAACHRADGGGSIGPNLTDDFWLHGGEAVAILARVRDGVPDKGMPAWGPVLGEAKVRAVAAYVLTLRGTNAPGGKAPQGEKTALNTL